MRRRRIAALIAVPLLLVSAAACGNDDSLRGRLSAGGDAGRRTPSPRWPRGRATRPRSCRSRSSRRATAPEVKKGDALNANYLGQTWTGQGVRQQLGPWGAGHLRDRQRQGHQGLGRGSGGPEARQPRRVGHPAGQGLRRAGQGQRSRRTPRWSSSWTSRRSCRKIEGKPVAQDNAELPKVGTNIDGKAPKITIPKGQDAPKERHRETIIEGKGAKIGSKAHRPCQLHGRTWKDGKVIADTWAPGQPGRRTFPSRSCRAGRKASRARRPAAGC